MIVDVYLFSNWGWYRSEGVLSIFVYFFWSFIVSCLKVFWVGMLVVYK